MLHKKVLNGITNNKKNKNKIELIMHTWAEQLKQRLPLQLKQLKRMSKYPDR